MSDAAAATAPEPVVIPPADVPPEPAAPKSFDERWKAKAAVEPVVDEPAEPAQPAAPKATPAKPAPAGDADRAQLKALAAKLGLEVDEKGVTTADAIAVRAQKRQNLAWKAEQEAKFAKERTEWEATHGPKLKRTEAADAAFESGDPDAFAQAYGAKDWNDLQASFLNRIADPNYKEVQAIKAKLAEKEKAEEEAKKQAEEQAKLREVHQRRANYFKTLSEQCKASSDPLAQALAEDMGFLNDVFQVQKENWNEEEGRTVTVEEAIKRASKNGPSLYDRMKAFKERLDKGFGGAPAVAAPAAAAPAPKTSKKPAPKTAVTPPNTVEGGGAPKKPSDMSPQEWREYTRKRMEAEAD